MPAKRHTQTPTHSRKSQLDGGGREKVSNSSNSSVEEKAVRSSNMVTVLVLVSRITGFFRTSAQAWALGAYGLASAYTVANNLPNTLYELVVGGMLITAFLPVYISVRQEAGREGASAYASNLLSIVVLLMLILTVLSVIFAVPIVWTQSAGATEGFDSDLSVWFFRWFACEIVLYALSSIISGVLNAERDYFASNAAPIINNVIVIGSFVLYAYLVNSVGMEWRQAAIALAVGNPLGVAVQALIQIPALMRHGVRLRLRVNFHDPALKKTLTIGLPTLVITLASTPTAAVMSSCALQVTPAGASIAYYARVWYVLPFSIFAIPISVTMFTELSNSYMQEDIASFKEFFITGMRRILFTLIPFALFLIVFASSLVAVLTSGSFTSESAVLTVGYLQALALSLPFYGIQSYLQKVCASMMRMNFFTAAVVIASIIQCAICIVFTPLWGLYVVPVSSVFFYGVIDAVVIVHIRKELGAFGVRSVLVASLRAIAFGVAGSLVGGGIVYAITAAFGPSVGLVRGVLYAMAGGIPAVLVTFGISWALGMSDAPFFDAIFARLLPGRAKAAR